MFDLLAALGAAPAGDRLERIRRSPHYRDGAFRNPVPTSMMAPGGYWRSWVRQFRGTEQRVPARPLPVVFGDASRYVEPPSSGLRITWLGHSSMLVEIDGYRVLIDPVLGERASPSGLVGPKRFHPAPMTVHELPALDVVLLTHDHYDHLDMGVIRGLLASPAQEGAAFATALGVGAHLERWGVPRARITELDWSESARYGDLAITACPARHFSGRLVTRDQTLWASWVLAGPKHRVFHSGDTGFFDELAEVGAKYGPFDVAMMKIGAYDTLWPEIHLDPEEAVRVHQLLRARLLLPIHWGTFNLAFHPWDEPIERLLRAAAAAGVHIAVPTPGDWVEPATAPAQPDPWWRAV